MITFRLTPCLPALVLRTIGWAAPAGLPALVPCRLEYTVVEGWLGWACWLGRACWLLVAATLLVLPRMWLAGLSVPVDELMLEGFFILVG